MNSHRALHRPAMAGFRAGRLSNMVSFLGYTTTALILPSQVGLLHVGMVDQGGSFALEGDFPSF